MRTTEDNRNHLSLVRKEFFERTGRIPGNMWEAWNYLVDEALGVVHRGSSPRAVKKANKLISYYNRLLKTSVSVDGHLLNKLVEAMAGDIAARESPSRSLSPVVITQAPEKKKGMFNGRKN